MVKSKSSDTLYNQSEASLRGFVFKGYIIPMITEVLSQASIFDYMRWATIATICLTNYKVKPSVAPTKSISQ